MSWICQRCRAECTTAGHWCGPASEDPAPALRARVKFLEDEIVLFEGGRDCLRARVAELEAKLEAEDRLNQIIAGHRDDLKKDVRKLRGALQDIADENTGVDPATFAYAVLNPE